MKHLLRVLCPILVLLIVATVFVVCDVMSAKDQVTVECETFYGDRSRAHGITLDIQSHYKGHLFWDTRFTDAVEPETDTECSFYNIERYSEHSRQQDVLTVSVDLPRDEDAVRLWNLDEVYSNVISDLERGESVTKKLFIKNYCEYYPLSLSICLPSDSMGWTGNPAYQGEQSHVNESRAEIMMDFFRIPLHSTHLYDINFSRHKYVDTLDISTDTSTVSGQYFKLHTQSVQSEDGFYFVFDAHVDSYVPTSNTVDTDQIKGGFGIYKLPYTKESWKNDVDITFETVFKLDPDHYILELEISSDGRQLYLFTYEDGMLTVTVIDTATYAEVQKIPVCSMKSHRTDLMYVLRDDYIAAMVDNSYAEQTMYLLSRDADGKLTLDFAADLNKYGESVAQKYSEEIRWEYITDLSVGYDGSRLVLCRPAYDSRSTYIEMLVYTKDGLQYSGRYTLSLGNRLPDDQYIPFFFDGKFVDISFE